MKSFFKILFNKLPNTSGSNTVKNTDFNADNEENVDGCCLGDGSIDAASIFEDDNDNVSI